MNTNIKSLITKSPFGDPGSSQFLGWQLSDRAFSIYGQVGVLVVSACAGKNWRFKSSPATISTGGEASRLGTVQPVTVEQLRPSSTTTSNKLTSGQKRNSWLSRIPGIIALHPDRVREYQNVTPITRNSRSDETG